MDIDYDTVWKRVNKYSSIERIKNNVDKAVGDEIRKQNLSGVKVDEDYKRFYPYSTLASKVLGFTGAETFLTATMNSCNPVFINVGLRLGVDRYYAYFDKFGLLNKTGIDLPGEAGTIMHKKENMGMVELAIMSRIPLRKMSHSLPFGPKMVLYQTKPVHHFG